MPIKSLDITNTADAPKKKNRGNRTPRTEIQKNQIRYGQQMRRIMGPSTLFLWLVNNHLTVRDSDLVQDMIRRMRDQVTRRYLERKEKLSGGS